MKHLLQALLSTLTDLKTRPLSYTGICGGVKSRYLDYVPKDVVITLERGDLMLEYTTQKMRELFLTWPPYSGDYVYPVPATSCNTPSEQYKETDKKWEGQYGDLRKDLLEHLIRGVQAELIESIRTSKIGAA
jgi:hypothetical protein